MIGFNRLNLFNRGESKKISRAVIESFIRFIQRWRVRLARKINLVYIYIYISSYLERRIGCYKRIFNGSGSHRSLETFGLSGSMRHKREGEGRIVSSTIYRIKERRFTKSGTIRRAEAPPGSQKKPPLPSRVSRKIWKPIKISVPCAALARKRRLGIFRMSLPPFFPFLLLIHLSLSLLSAQIYTPL